MKKSVLFFLITMHTTTLVAQQLVESPKVDVYEFLNIDLTKKYGDYGYSPYLNLKEPLTPVRFSSLIKDKKHFLSEFNFEDEVVLFNKEGYVEFITVRKLLNREKNESLGTQTVFFKKLIEKISTRYGPAKTEKYRLAKWETEYYIINVKLDEKDDVNVWYRPKTK